MKRIISVIISVVIIPLLFIKIQTPCQNIEIYYGLLAASIFILLLVEAPNISRLLKKPIYSLESMPIIDSPLRGREDYLSKIKDFLSDINKRIMIFEGESGLGKTSIVSSYINKSKKRFDLVIWQSLVDLPTMKEIVNNWLNLYTENIPDVSFYARLDAFLRKIKEYKHKKVLIVFDNCESVLQNQSGRILLPTEFIEFITRLIEYRACKIKIIMTSAVDLKDILPSQINVQLVRIEKLKNEMLSQIVYDRTRFKLDAEKLEIAHGNPSAALLIAEVVKSGISIFDETNQANSFDILVSKRMQLLDDRQRRLLEILSIVKYPMSISEIQDMWKQLPPYSAINQSEITSLKSTFLIESVSEDKFLINPIVASVLGTAVVEDLSKVIIGQNIEETSIINKLPLDYVGWTKTARNNTVSYLFPSTVSYLMHSYNFNITEIDKAHINKVLELNISKQDNSTYLASNVVAFLLFCGIDFNNVIFPAINLIGLDFSRVHMFNADLSEVHIINCQFADRIGAAYTVRFMGRERLIVGLASGSIELRNISDLLRITRIETHSQPVRALYYSDKSEKIVSGGEDGRVVIYDNNLSQLKTIEMHNQWIWQIVEISDNYILTVACGGFIGVIDLDTNSACGKFSVPSQRIWKATICKQELFLASEDGILWKCPLCDILSLHQPKWEIAANLQEPIKASCSCSGKVVIGCRDGKLFTIDKGKQDILADEGSCIRDIVKIAGSSRIITVGDSGISHVYDLESNKLLGEIPTQLSRTWAVDVLASGMAVTVGDDRSVCLWNAKEFIPVRSSYGNGQSLRGVDIYQDKIIFACADDFLRVLNNNVIEPWKTLAIRKRILGFVSLCNNRWACSFEDGKVFLGECEQVLLKINVHSSAIESIARNVDGTLFATGGEDRNINIFDSEGILQISPKPLHSSRIWALAFSPNSKKLASAGGDFIVAIWDVQSGGILGSCLGHNNLVLALCWLDDNSLVSAGTDGTIRLWNVETTTCLKMKVVPCLIRGLTQSENGVVYGVGRNSSEFPGWVIIKWDIQNDIFDLKGLEIFGGSAKTILNANGKIYIGGDLPFWLEIDPVSLEVINQYRIPGIYNNLRICANKCEGIDFDCLTLLGANIINDEEVLYDSRNSST